jgi:hypothetical protein
MLSSICSHFPIRNTTNLASKAPPPESSTPAPSFEEKQTKTQDVQPKPQPQATTQPSNSPLKNLTNIPPNKRATISSHTANDERAPSKPPSTALPAQQEPRNPPPPSTTTTTTTDPTHLLISSLVLAGRLSHTLHSLDSYITFKHDFATELVAEMGVVLGIVAEARALRERVGRIGEEG